MSRPNPTHHPDTDTSRATPTLSPTAETRASDYVNDHKAPTAETSNESSLGLDGMNEKTPQLAPPSTEIKTKTKNQGLFGGKSDSKGDKPASDDERPGIKPASIGSLFRFATRFEMTINIIGLLIAAIAGAALPCMTIVFGRLVSLFTNYGMVMRQIANEGWTPAGEDALVAAKAALKKESGNCALYLMAMGFAMFFLTYTYMLIWNYTSEAQSKRLREAYLRAVLRQEVCSSSSPSLR